MISLSDFKGNSQDRDDITNELKYELITSNGKPKFLVIDFEFAESMGGDVQAIISELMPSAKKSVKEKVIENRDMITGLIGDGERHIDIARRLGVHINSFRKAIKEIGISGDKRKVLTNRMVESGEDVINMIKEGASIKSVAESYGVSSTAVISHFGKFFKMRNFDRKNTTSYQFIQG